MTTLNTWAISSRAPGNPIPEFGFAYYIKSYNFFNRCPSSTSKQKNIDYDSPITLSRYISKNLFFASSVLNSFTPFTEATPPRKFASPSAFEGGKVE